MLTRRTAALLICFLAAATLGAQDSSKPKAKPKSPKSYIPNVTTITSFDKDHTVVGWLEIIPFDSSIYHEQRTLRVLVPANYFSPYNRHRSYPVLYLQDGQNLFDTVTAHNGEWRVDETVEHLVGGFKIPPMFVVGIDNAGDKRSSEYLPYPDSYNSSTADAKSVHGAEYSRFLITEVMPFIEKHYRVSHGAANTGIGGSSYGADIALYTALKHPGVFGHVLLESPLLSIGDGQLLKDAAEARVLPAKIVIGSGTAETDDAKRNTEIVDDVNILQTILRKKGMGPTRLKVVVEDGAQHNEAAWSRRLPDDLVFLYGQ
jgi:predicted alpha/beta superfamily hydrolase